MPHLEKGRQAFTGTTGKKKKATRFTTEQLGIIESERQRFTGTSKTPGGVDLTSLLIRGTEGVGTAPGVLAGRSAFLQAQRTPGPVTSGPDFAPPPKTTPDTPREKTEKRRRFQTGTGKRKKRINLSNVGGRFALLRALGAGRLLAG